MRACCDSPYFPTSLYLYIIMPGCPLVEYIPTPFRRPIWGFNDNSYQITLNFFHDCRCHLWKATPAKSPANNLPISLLLEKALQYTKASILVISRPFVYISGCFCSILWFVTEIAHCFVDSEALKTRISQRYAAALQSSRMCPGLQP
jgi:hypothetical protein